MKKEKTRYFAFVLRSLTQLDCEESVGKKGLCMLDVRSFADFQTIFFFITRIRYLSSLVSGNFMFDLLRIRTRYTKWLNLIISTKFRWNSFSKSCKSNLVFRIIIRYAKKLLLYRVRWKLKASRNSLSNHECLSYNSKQNANFSITKDLKKQRKIISPMKIRDMYTRLYIYIYI